jgi:hypothetical protein
MIPVNSFRLSYRKISGFLDAWIAGFLASQKAGLPDFQTANDLITTRRRSEPTAPDKERDDRRTLHALRHDRHDTPALDGKRGTLLQLDWIHRQS